MPSPISEYVPQVGGRPPRRVWAAWGACVALAALVAGLILLAPLARAGGWTLLSVALYRSFAVACHQLPERAFDLAGHPLAVCARCWGLYAGALGGLALYPFVRSLARADAPRRGWLLLAAAPTTVDFLLGVTGLWENTHASRFWTALALGAASAFYVTPAVVELSLKAPLRRPRGAGRLQAGAAPAPKLYQS